MASKNINVKTWKQRIIALKNVTEKIYSWKKITIARLSRSLDSCPGRGARPFANRKRPGGGLLAPPPPPVSQLVVKWEAILAKIKTFFDLRSLSVWKAILFGQINMFLHFFWPFFLTFRQSQGSQVRHFLIFFRAKISCYAILRVGQCWDFLRHNDFRFGEAQPF